MSETTNPPARRTRMRVPVSPPTTTLGDLPPSAEAREAATAIVPNAGGGEVVQPRVPQQLGGEQPRAKREWEERGMWGVVVEDLERIDVPATYYRLRDALSLGDNAVAYGEVLAALDMAERNCFEAGQLVRLAKLEQSKVDLLCEEEMEVLRTQAKEDITKERTGQLANGATNSAEEGEEAHKKGAKTKVSPGRITLQELEDRVLQYYSAYVRRLTRRKEEAHGVRATMEYLQEAWASRCATLRLMAEKVASHR